MSSEYYFHKWKSTLNDLEELVKFDLESQSKKIHDKNLCGAVARLTGVLGRYIQLHNAALECLQQNLQVQKTHYIAEIVKTITNRILELKHEIRKLECTNIQFMGHGLTDHKLTPYDAELTDVPPHSERPGHIEVLIEEAFRKAEQRKQELLELAQKEEAEKLKDGMDQTGIWWDEDEKEPSVVVPATEKESEETILRREMVSLIQAHERSRQVIRHLTHKRQMREMWEKELMGTMHPQAPLERRVRSAQLIQKVFRAYFEIKRNRIKQCRTDEILGLRLCKKVIKDASEKADQIKFKRMEQRKRFEQEWKSSCEKLKEDFLKSNIDIFAEDYRDFIRWWFRKWFDDIKFFYDIPKDFEGGTVPIMKGEVPEPIEWWEEYEKYMENKKANKGQSEMQRKFAAMQAKEEEMMKKKEDEMKKKLQAELMRKLMKNPTQHPGFDYPKSVKTESILEVINKYRKDWDDLDSFGTSDVKIKFVHAIDINNVYAEVKQEIMESVNEDMRNELKLLKKALKNDYAQADMKMPEPMKTSGRKRNKKKKLKGIMSEGIPEKLEDLAFRGVLKQYTRIKLEDFSGDHNYAGDDIRCNFEPASPFNGELRSIWWEQCRQVAHGSHHIMLVGPKLSGKTLLVHALATINDAVLFVLDPTKLQEVSRADLTRIAASVVTCARALQPSVIYIRHVHKLYFKNKVPPGEIVNNANDMKKIFINKLCKKIQKPDKIAIIGSCLDPWLTKSQQLLKQFNNVILVPNTSYSIVVKLLKHWINDNHTLPRDLQVGGLARALQGFSYGFLKQMLTEYLTPERIAQVAAYGLLPQQIYEYFLDDELSGGKAEYEKYMKWYYDQTQWGKKESKHIAEQREFMQALKIFEDRNKKKKKVASAVSSAATLYSQE